MLNFSTPSSDWSIISSYNIINESNTEVMRNKEIIIDLRSSWWLTNAPCQHHTDAGKTRRPSRDWFKFFVQLVGRVARVFWTNHRAKWNKTNAMPDYFRHYWKELYPAVYIGEILLICFYFALNKGKPTEASKEMTVKQYGELKTTDFVPGTEVNCLRRWDYRISKPVHHPWDCGLMLLRNPVIL